MLDISAPTVWRLFRERKLVKYRVSGRVVARVSDVLRMPQRAA
jgi:hypothetical protein